MLLKCTIVKKFQIQWFKTDFRYYIKKDVVNNSIDDKGLNMLHVLEKDQNVAKTWYIFCRARKIDHGEVFLKSLKPREIFQK